MLEAVILLSSLLFYDPSHGEEFVHAKAKQDVIEHAEAVEIINHGECNDR